MCRSQIATVLDIGCGSGVLAIAAVKLGARSAVGIDIDPDALGNARENAALNDMRERVQFEEGDFRDDGAQRRCRRGQSHGRPAGTIRARRWRRSSRQADV